MTIYITRFKLNNIPQFCAHSTQEQAERHINFLGQNENVKPNPIFQMTDVNLTTDLIELINELNSLNK